MCEQTLAKAVDDWAVAEGEEFRFVQKVHRDGVEVGFDYPRVTVTVRASCTYLQYNRSALLAKETVHSSAPDL